MRARAAVRHFTLNFKLDSHGLLCYMKRKDSEIAQGESKERRRRVICQLSMTTIPNTFRQIRIFTIDCSHSARSTKPICTHETCICLIDIIENKSVYKADAYRTIDATTIARHPAKTGRAYLTLVAPFLFMGPILYGGSYPAETFVLFTVPSQQKCWKHCLQTSGKGVFVLSKLRLRIAQPTHVPHVLSVEPLPIVATLYPFRMIRFLSLVL